MAKFSKSKRQKIIDDYLAETGSNMFSASEFVDWLEDHPDHEAYPWFFSKDDAALARQYRIDLARRMVSGLRIVTTIHNAESKVVTITTREFPAYVSPMAGRNGGGGYGRFDPSSPTDVDALVQEGVAALRSWLERYRGAFGVVGADVSAVEEIVARTEGRVALSA
jgi:hypothetical protein